MSYFDASTYKFICNLDRTSVTNPETDECDAIVDNWRVADFEQTFQLKIVKNRDDFLEFEMTYVDAPVVNAIRRIAMSEVPTMAIEKVFIADNTTIFQDDFLAHRIGLIPICADPRLFEYRNEGDQEGTPQDTIELSLKVKCIKNPEASKETGVTDLYLNRSVKSSSIKWVPIGNQAELIKEPIGPVNDDILIAKMSPGQALDLKLHCIKGIGRDHAKFSPVATVYYRLMPKIEIVKPIYGDDARLLQSCFTKGVIGVKNKDGRAEAYVKDARKDTLSRNFFRHRQFDGAIKMGLEKQHFIFTLESTGVLTAETVFNEAAEILINKCLNLIREVRIVRESLVQ